LHRQSDGYAGNQPRRDSFLQLLPFCKDGWYGVQPVAHPASSFLQAAGGVPNLK
jgi:hypothetical protein